MDSVKKINNITTQESIVHINDKSFKVISYFEGTETASKLIYDMAVKRVLNEPMPTMKSQDVQYE